MREERENESKTIEKSFSIVPVPVVVSLLFSVRLIQVPQNKWRQQYVVWINKERAERERERTAKDRGYSFLDEECIKSVVV